MQLQRRSFQHACWDHLVVAPLWVAYEANLGTLLRTCDAVGACMAVPSTEHYRRSLARGDTLVERPHIHWVNCSKTSWIDHQRKQGSTILAVELAEDATPLTRLEPARERTVVLLGHEHRGVPEEVWPLLDAVVEIPMVGKGASLNVAVAGSESPWTSRRKIELAELINEPWILPPYNSVPGPFIKDIFHAYGLEPPTPSISTLSNQLTTTLIATGRFLGLLNRTVVASSGVPVGLKILSVDIPPHTITVDIITIKNRTLSPLAEAFIDCAREIAKPLKDRA